MTIWQAPKVTEDMGMEDLKNLVAMLIKDVDFIINGNIDSKNVREIAGYLVDLLVLKHKSGIVGMSGADPDNPEAVRFWAGLADLLNAPFRVLQNGKFYATDGELTGRIVAKSGTIGGFTIEEDRLFGEGLIEGGTVRGALIQTSESGARIELRDNTLKTFNEAGQLQGFSWGTDTSSESYGDAFFLIGGNKALEIYNQITGVSIRPLPGYTMGLGASGRQTFGVGNWSFSQTITGNITNAEVAKTANYATTAGSATTAASSEMATAIQPTGIANGTYTKLTIGTDGRAYGGSTLSSSDIPAITLSKITDAGSAASKTAGSAAGNVPVLDGSAKLSSAMIPTSFADKVEVTNGVYSVYMLPDGYIANNAYNDAGTWKRKNTSIGASLMGIELGSGRPLTYYAAAGANPIAWSGPYEFVTSQTVIKGTGSPEGNVPAPVGSMYLRSDGGASSTMYVKESGAGATGWVAK